MLRKMVLFLYIGTEEIISPQVTLELYFLKNHEKSEKSDLIEVLPWTDAVKNMRDHVKTKTGQYCNHLVVNQYLNGKDHIGFHKDKVFHRDFSILNIPR